jgi:hypothetical protein
MLDGRSYYDQKSWLFYVLQVTLIVYGLGVIAYLVPLQNAAVTDTHFPGTSSGVHYTQRYISMQWWALFFSAFHILGFVCICIIFLYRNHYGCFLGWFILFFIIVILDACTVIVLGASYNRCNTERDNLCNDLRWCFVPSIHAIATNGCPYTGPDFIHDAPTVLTVNDLYPNPDFLWLFYVNLFYLLLDVLFVFFFAGVFCVMPFPVKPRRSATNQPKPSAPLQSMLKTPLPYIPFDQKDTKGE